MAAFSLFTRNKRSGVLLNFTEHCVQLARLGRLDEKPLVVDSFAELAAADDEGVARWLDGAYTERGPGYLAGYCGFHPVDRVLLRENVNTRRLAEPDYLAGFLAEQAKLPALKDWQVCAVHPVDGELFTANTPPRPGLMLGLPRASVRDTQQRLRNLNIRPRRLEVGTVALLGAITRYVRETSYPHATVVCEIGLGHTRVYFLGKEGVHTPAILPHGLVSIMEATMKELAAPGIGVARDTLYAPTEELRAHSRRIVRILTRHLKPAIDYFEMQTGQPIGALFAGHLPARLAWLEEALCAAVDLEFLSPDLAAWIPSIGLQLPSDTLPPTRSWFQALSLIGQLAPPAHEAKS